MEKVKLVGLPELYYEEFKKSGMRLDSKANSALSQLVSDIPSCEMEVELVVLSVTELGFMKEATLKDIYTRANGLGLDLCPLEVGPQLRLQYTDQPKCETLFIATKPITYLPNLPTILLLVLHDGTELWLSDSVSSLDSIYYGSNRFVFLRRHVVTGIERVIN